MTVGGGLAVIDILGLGVHRLTWQAVALGPGGPMTVGGGLAVIDILGLGVHRLTWQAVALGPGGPHDRRRGPVAPVFGVPL